MWVRYGRRAEMGGIRKSAPFLHLRVPLMGGTLGGWGGIMIPGLVPLARLHAKCYLMRARR